MRIVGESRVCNAVLALIGLAALAFVLYAAFCVAGCAPPAARPMLIPNAELYGDDFWCGFPVDGYLDLDSNKIGRRACPVDANSYQ